ncbi:hypothetical protein [Streptomyces sp. NPDC050504]|uniref:hypothetical protein n=1 Tax=Streptomyces sp. NPDC050504 TaxID=3365618 RepID=UPI003792A120
MKVFISWSGPQSKLMAESLKSWLKYVIQAIDPFVSSLDIAKGDRGLRVIATELEQTSLGIICVTRENSQAPWINFEAGALSKALGEARVIPCLLDLPVKDLTGPLAQFQAASSASREDVLAMVRTVRDHVNLGDLDDARLDETFDLFWPRLEKALKQARELPGASPDATPVRDTGDVLEEVLVLTRRQESVMRTLFARLDSSAPMLRVKPERDDQVPAADRKAQRQIIDELIGHLSVPQDRALNYRVITDRIPEEYQVVYEAGAISNSTAELLAREVDEYAEVRGVHVSVKSEDGYEIIAGPDRETLLLPPALPLAPHRAGRPGDGESATGSSAVPGPSAVPGSPAASGATEVPESFTATERYTAAE